MKKFSPLVIFFIIILFSGVLIFTFNDSGPKKPIKYGYEGFKIAGVDVKGKTKEEVIQEIKDNISKGQKDIVINLKDRQKTIPKNYLIEVYDIEGTVDSGFDYMRSLSKRDKKEFKKGNLEKDVALKFSTKHENLNKLLGELAKEERVEAINPKIEIKDGSVHIIDGKDGIEIDIEHFKEELIELIFKEADREESIINMKYKSFEPPIKKQDLEKINTRIAHTVSKFTDDENRTINISLASNKINGLMIKPLEEFSFNNVVGNPSEENGYKQSKVYVGNKVENGIGGGVCQVSSTLYSSVLKAGVNLKNIERTPHSMTISYTDPGFDATVDYNNIDFKFINTLADNIYIDSNLVGNELIVDIYSSKQEFDYKLSSDIYETKKFEKEIIKDPSITDEKEHKEINGVDGFKVKSYREKYKDDKLIEKVEISDDTYNPINEIIKVK